jgi:hypothetical protein
MEIELKILIDSVEKVHEFQNILADHDGDFDLVSGRTEVDARSFLGIMTLNLSEPLTLRANTTSDKLIEDLDGFVVA